MNRSRREIPMRPVDDSDIPRPIRNIDAPEPQHTQVMKDRAAAKEKRLANVDPAAADAEYARMKARAEERLAKKEMDKLPEYDGEMIEVSDDETPGRVEINLNDGKMSPEARAKATALGGQEIVSAQDLGFESQEDMDEDEMYTEKMSTEEVEAVRRQSKERMYAEVFEQRLNEETARATHEAAERMQSANARLQTAGIKMAQRIGGAVANLWSSRPRIEKQNAPSVPVEIPAATQESRPKFTDRLRSWFGIGNKAEQTPKPESKTAQQAEREWLGEDFAEWFEGEETGHESIADAILEDAKDNGPEISLVLPLLENQLTDDDLKTISARTKVPLKTVKTWMKKGLSQLEAAWNYPRTAQDIEADLAERTNTRNDSSLDEGEKKKRLGNEFGFFANALAVSSFDVLRSYIKPRDQGFSDSVTAEVIRFGASGIRSFKNDFANEAVPGIARVAYEFAKMPLVPETRRRMVREDVERIENIAIAAKDAGRRAKNAIADAFDRLTSEKWLAELRATERKIDALSKKLDDISKYEQSSTAFRKKERDAARPKNIEKASAERYALTVEYKTASQEDQKLIATRIDVLNTIINELKGGNEDNSVEHEERLQTIARLELAKERAEKLRGANERINNLSLNMSEPYAGEPHPFGVEKRVNLSDDVEEIALGDIHDQPLGKDAKVTFLNVEKAPKKAAARTPKLRAIKQPAAIDSNDTDLPLAAK